MHEYTERNNLDNMISNCLKKSCDANGYITKNSILPFRLTGFHLPPPVTSTKSVFSLRLTSDFAVSAHGFKVYYEGK